MIERSDLEDVLPLAPLQEGLLFHTLLDAHGPDPYTTQAILDVDGHLDVATLHTAGQALLDRYPNLRAAFRRTNQGRAVARIPRQVRLPWQMADLSTLDAATGHAQADRLFADEQARRFDLARPPLIRLLLVRLCAGRHRLGITNHHILIDGWSFPILVQELFALYASGGDPAALPPVTPYRDYLVWLGAQDRLAAETAWRDALAGLDEPTLVAGADRQRVPLIPDQLAVELSEELTAALIGQARRLDMTLNTLVQGAWGILLGRITGRRDVVFGVTVSGRSADLAGVASMVGLLANTVPVRIQLRPGEPVGRFLARLQAEQARLLAHHHLGLVDIQQLAGLGQLFDTLVAYENYPVDSSRCTEVAPGLRITAQEGHDATHYPLTLVTVPGHCLALRLGYRSDAIDGMAAQEMLGRLVRVLEQLATDAGRPVGRIDVLDAAQRHQILVAWNDTAVEVPETTLPALFEAQVAATPHAVAVVFEDTTLTYAQLNARANRLARTLIAQGIGPEHIVALALPRSLELVVCLMAVLKAGAAYLPVDSSYPTARIGFMLDDARPVLLLTSTQTLGCVPHDDATPRLVIDDPRTVAVVGEYPDTDPTNTDRTDRLLPQHPAYVIYTSGSTGQPKGVMVSQRNVTDLVEWAVADIGTRRLSRVLASTSLSFDVSVFEVFAPLVAGGSIEIICDLLALVGRRWSGSLINAVPSALSNLIGHGGADIDTQMVALAGEALPARVISEIRAALPGCRLANIYGPTEATVYSTAWYSDGAVEGAPPIGRPISNTRVYVLDTGLQPVPPGVMGELYIGGVGLARGYVGRPGLTAERFVADPFGPAGTRVYRTGDLVRWRAEGDLEFAGRVDDQVKIRGFRIEPGEIETVLAGHPDVTQAVVIAREDQLGDKRLVAYAVAVSDEPQPDSLREFLRDRLPEYMVPAAVVMLEELPLTPNGKLDRGALPVPELSAAGTGRAPRTPQEQLLAELFAEVLGLAGVGAGDDFFGLGGHSLLATRLIARIRASFGVEVELRELFDNPTVVGMAARLDDARPARLTLAAVARPDPMPLSFAQRRLWFLYQLEGPTQNGYSATYNIPLALRLSGELDRPALHAALGDVTARHESLRTIFPQADGTPSQLVLDIEVAHPALPTTHLSETDLPEALAVAAQRGFDLTTEAPLRAELFVLAPDEHVLLLVVHHIASDGWSLGPLSRDLATAYTARCHGAEPGWAALPVQYADYTLWQHQLLGDSTDPDSLFTRQLAYWTETLAGLPEQLELPTDRPRPAVASHRGGLVEVHWDAQLHRGLVSLARRGGASVFMVLQAGLAALLSRLGAGDDIAVGSPIAGRTDHALDDLVGFFVNTLVLRTDTSGHPTFRQLLARVRETALAAYAHQDVPFEYLVEILNPTRSLAHHPLFQVMLALQNTPQPDFPLPGLNTNLLPTPTATARFDLSISFHEQRGPHGTPEGINGIIEYASDLFDPITIETLITRWARILEAVTTNPDQPINRPDILDAAERLHLLVDRNNTAVKMPQTTLQALFEAQVAATPYAVAVEFENTTLTYTQLNARANRLAHSLIAHDAGPERIVALALPRSPELLVAIIAVLKTGAAYLPVDPSYPAARIGFMLDDAQPILILTSAQTLESVPYPDTNPTNTDRTASLLPEHPAYMIYTSGSTGQPKGVVVTHRAVVNHMLWMQRSVPLSERDTVLHRTSVAFDASVWELFAPLIAGEGSRIFRTVNPLGFPFRKRGITCRRIVGRSLLSTRTKLRRW
ncbi:MAG: amino acid adenylation domain-containing protein, partial [Pseudonocardiaceae bacterium]